MPKTETSKNLPHGYRIVELSNEDFEKHCGPWRSKIFSDNDTSMNLRLVMSDGERQKVRPLAQGFFKLYNLNLGVFKGDEFCGWASGDQYNQETYYMRNSAISCQIIASRAFTQPL